MFWEHPTESNHMRIQCLFLIALMSTLLSLDGVAAAKQPNILFIFSDDHTRQAISAYKHPLKLIETPNLDRIAKEGMIFERCLVPNPICGPSRAVILSGKYTPV